MIKPTMPNIPGMGAMTDTLEFVKNLWGGMSIPGAGVPGMVMPTLSVEEINKQIADLRAVESWLNVNMNMLRTTIQALEVQSATIATIQSMGESFGSVARANAETAAGAVRAATRPASHAADDAAEAAEIQSEKRRSARRELKEEFAASGAAQERGKADGKTEGKADGKAAAASPAGGDFATPLANPALWWNMLQDQFKQAVGTAMTSEPDIPAAAKANAGKSPSKSSGKSAATKRKPKPGIKSL